MSSDFDPRTMPPSLRVTRRRVVAGAAALGGAAFAASGGAFGGTAAGPAPLLVAGPELDEALARRLAETMGARALCMAAGAEPVRFWTGQVAPGMTRGVPVLGLTSWSDYLVFRGMAAEARRHVRFETGAASPGSSAGAPLARDLAALAGPLRAAADQAGRMGFSAGVSWILA